MTSVSGIVLTGGGARGAYQAGVLKRIGESKCVQTHGNPFSIIGGSSAGAINGAALAIGSSDFAATTAILARLWAQLTPTDIFRCDLLSQAQNSLTWIMDLSFGGVLGGGHARSLLDASPLRHYVNKHIPCHLIQASIKQGHLYAFTIAATNYSSGKAYLFIQGQPGHPMWSKSRRVTVSTRIGADHICASAAIPLIFRPVKLQVAQDTDYYGDGCLRLQQPLSPVIRLGADKILAIGVCRDTAEQQAAATEPPVAQVMGVLFNAMFLDHLAADIEHMERLNQLLELGQINRDGKGGREVMRPLKALLIAPSVNFSELAQHYQQEMPYLIQYFVNGLGREAASCAELMSYLMFTSTYTKALIDTGYKDAAARIDEIEDFLYSGTNGVTASPAKRRAS